ncbi:hypothetical protein [Stutzerimonas stutzeri]|uniref:hypothetical protein n=1 Tax=Stutzerimonas stutzeri TaxID=316 RepID=UPI003C6F43BE
MKDELSAMALAGKWEIELSRNAEAKRLENIHARGVEVTELSEAEQQAFVDATRSVQEKWTAKIGADLVEAARTAVAK